MPILATPSTVARPTSASVSWSGFQAMTWTGADGSQFDLLSPDSGTLLMAGARGLNMPSLTDYTSESPALDGARFRGSRTNQREVFWPLLVYSDAGSQAWVEYDREFWNSLRPGQVGLWTVTHPNGDTRTLRCRFKDDGGQSYDVDPSLVGWAAYGITLVADQPYWEGAAVTRTWKASQPVSFFGGGTGGPPFTISPGSTLAKATMPNPGDVDAYPMWVLTGPIDIASVGLSGKLTQYQASIASGRSVVIDTSPDQQRVVEIASPPDPDSGGPDVGSQEWLDWISAAMSTGTDRVLNLGSVAFNAPVSPGRSVSLSLSMVGDGTVTAAIVPYYFRAT